MQLKSINELQDTNIEEKLRKKTLHLTSNDFIIAKTILNNLGLKYIEASTEADNISVEMFKLGLVDLCISNDMDFLPRGCTKLVNFNSDGIVYTDLNLILSECLKISYDDFIEMCVILGVDNSQKHVFFRNPTTNIRLKPIDIYNKIYQYVLERNNDVELFNITYPHGLIQRFLCEFVSNNDELNKILNIYLTDKKYLLSFDNTVKPIIRFTLNTSLVLNGEIISLLKNTSYSDIALLSRDIDFINKLIQNNIFIQ